MMAVDAAPGCTLDLDKQTHHPGQVQHDVHEHPHPDRGPGGAPAEAVGRAGRVRDGERERHPGAHRGIHAVFAADITLKPGANTLTFVGQNLDSDDADGNPAGLAWKLEWTDGDTAPRRRARCRSRPGSPHGLPAGPEFLESNFTANRPTGGGPVVLNASADGKTPLLVDDSLEIRVIHADGTTATQSNQFTPVCAAPLEAGNVDTTSLLGAGRNQVKLIFSDVCGANVSTTPVYVTGEGSFTLLPPTPINTYEVTAAASAEPVPPSRVLLTKTFTAVQPADGGRAVLTGSADGLNPLLVDDAIEISVAHADGTTLTGSIRFNPVCAAPNEAQNFDIADYLQPGANPVMIKVVDVCGGAVSTTDMYVRSNGTYSDS